VRESQSQNISRRKSRRQGLLTHKEHVRLTILAVLLVALLLVGRELGWRSKRVSTRPSVPETRAPFPDMTMLEAVAAEDYQKLGVEETPETLRILLEWAANGGPGAESSVYTSYADLVEFPDKYRGEGVIIEGQVMRMAEGTVPGVASEGQLMDVGRQMYSFFAAGDLGLAEGAQVRLYGIFYRIAGYENRKGGFEVTPVVVLWGAEPLEEGAPWWKWGGAAIAIAAFLLVGIFLVSRYEARDRIRLRQEVARRRSERSNGSPHSAV